jgi:hypothetical protein
LPITKYLPGFKKDDNGKYAYYGNDKDEGVELLEKYLRDLKQDGNNNKYSVHLVAAKRVLRLALLFNSMMMHPPPFQVIARTMKF